MSYAYILLSEQSLARVRSHIRSCVEQWAQHYLGRVDVSCSVKTKTLDIASAQKWVVTGDRATDLSIEHHELRLLLDQSQAQGVWTYITGTVPNPDSLLSSDQRYIVGRTLRLLLDKLHAGATSPSERAAGFSEAARAGSGWSVHKIVLDELCFDIAVPPQNALGWLGKSIPGTTQTKAALIPLKSAIRPSEVTLSAVLGKISIRLDDLRHLAAGDVLTLDRQLTDSLQLVTQSGTYVSDARLGCFSGNKALVITNTK